MAKNRVQILPTWLLALSASVWLILVPALAVIATPKSYGEELAKVVASSLSSAAFGVLVAGLLVDRYKSQEHKRDQERAEQAWLELNGSLVAALLTDTRELLGDLLPSVYKKIGPLISSDDLIEDRFLWHAVKEHPYGSLVDTLGPPMGGALDHAVGQWRGARRAVLSLTRFEFDADDEVVNRDLTTGQVLIEGSQFDAFLQSARDGASTIVSQATAVHDVVDQFDQRFIGDQRATPLADAVQLRLAARQYKRETDNYFGGDAIRVFGVVNSGVSIISASRGLLRQLWMLELDWRRRVPRDNPVMQTFELVSRISQELEREEWQLLKDKRFRQSGHSSRSNVDPETEPT